MKKCSRVKNLPVSFFSVILGLAWFIIVLQKLQYIVKIPNILINYIVLIVLIIFLLLIFLYLKKFFLYKNDIIKEINHPIKWPFFSTISISFILFSIVFLEYNLIISFVLRIIWASTQFIFLIKTLSGWINKEHFVYFFNKNFVWVDKQGIFWNKTYKSSSIYSNSMKYLTTNIWYYTRMKRNIFIFF